MAWNARIIGLDVSSKHDDAASCVPLLVVGVDPSSVYVTVAVLAHTAQYVGVTGGEVVVQTPATDTPRGSTRPAAVDIDTPCEPGQSGVSAIGNGVTVPSWFW